MLLSNEGYTITQLQAIFQIRRDMINRWIDRFNEQGIAGLADLPRSGFCPLEAFFVGRAHFFARHDAFNVVLFGMQNSVHTLYIYLTL